MKFCLACIKQSLLKTDKKIKSFLFVLLCFTNMTKLCLIFFKKCHTSYFISCFVLFLFPFTGAFIREKTMTLLLRRKKMHNYVVWWPFHLEESILFLLHYPDLTRVKFRVLNQAICHNCVTQTKKLQSLGTIFCWFCSIQALIRKEAKSQIRRFVAGLVYLILIWIV